MQIIQKCLLLSFLIVITYSQDCLNQDGNPVDWWFILKMPYNKKERWSGLEYFYCDSANNCKEFQLQNGKLDSPDSPLMRSIKQIKFDDDDVFSMLWSDQPFKDLTYSTHAHSKGIMSARFNGDQKAFVISHSTPRFPKLDDERKIMMEVEDNFNKYGQHYLCISTTTQAIDDNLAELLYEAEIQIYQASAKPPKYATNKFLKIYALWQTKRPQSKGETAHKYHKSENLYSQYTFKTRNREIFEIYSKNEKFEQDFYADVVAPDLQQNLIMETWVRQRGKRLDEPECRQSQKTSSNERVRFEGEIDDQDYIFEYSYTKDHSKYGITLPEVDSFSSAGASFLETDDAHSPLKGQIFASEQNSRKKQIEHFNGDDDDEDMDVDDHPTVVEHPVVVKKPAVPEPKSEEKFLGRKRGRDESGGSSSKKLRTKGIYYVCVSDLNRQESQWKRGGIVYCLQNINLWNHINEAFIGKQTCP